MSVEPTYCLKWSNFQENARLAFSDLRDGGDFSDVTLACDGLEISAHRVVLAAASPFFSRVLGRARHPHPLLYLTGLEAEDLGAVVDFIYRGEVNIYQVMRRFTIRLTSHSSK
jgi:hypothetical protein